MIKHGVQLVFVILASNFAHGENVCSICACSAKTINCRSLKLKKSFDKDDWLNVNTSSVVEGDFADNQIGHLTKFPILPFVKLSFKNNRLVKIEDRAFKNLTSLEELNLSENELTSNNLLPAVFEGQHDAEYYEPLQLRLLDLSSNELHTLHPDLFEHLPHLERLYLGKNPFKILDKPTIIAVSSVPNLKVLDLSSTKIKELPAGFLHTPRKLHELVLRRNFFTQVPTDVLAESHDLKILNLNENPIKILSSERPFPEMPSLLQLHISFMPNLTRIEKGSLAGLTNLEYLDCRMNEKLSFISPDSFKKKDSDHHWPNMVKLDLSDNSLRYLDHEFLKPVWNKIRELNIIGNPWVCDCENQWMISDLVPLLLNVSSPLEGLECAEPTAMKGQRFTALHAKSYSMRCLDLYGNHPENDGPILISIFVIVILILVTALGVVFFLKNNSCRQGGPVNYQRAFYRPTRLEDPDKY